MYLLITKGALPQPLTLLIRSVVEFINLILKLYFMMILLRVILSWVNPDPRNPVMSMLYSLTEPVLAPARRLMPPIGGLDISAMLVLLVIIVLQTFFNLDLMPRLLN
jgi:YggT family protein